MENPAGLLVHDVGVSFRIQGTGEPLPEPNWPTGFNRLALLGFGQQIVLVRPAGCGTDGRRPFVEPRRGPPRNWPALPKATGRGKSPNPPDSPTTDAQSRAQR